MFKRLIWVLSLVLILGMALSACGAPAAAPADEAAPAEAADAEATAPAEEEAAPAEGEGSERSKTLIMDIDGGRVADPEVWNPLVPGWRGDAGFNQTILEPLLYPQLPDRRN